MSDNQAQPDEKLPVLEPVEVKEVDFYGDLVVAAQVNLADKLQVVVPVRPICDYLGLDWSSQRKRILRDPVLSKKIVSVVIMTTETTGQGKGRREQTCLQLEFLPGFLFGITASKVKEEFRSRIILYQEECYLTLWQAFKKDVLNSANIKLLDSATVNYVPNPGLLEAHELAVSVVRSLEEQIELERRLWEQQTLMRKDIDFAHFRLDEAKKYVGYLAKRLGTAEQRLDATEQRLTNTEDWITEHDFLLPSQAHQITDMVNRLVKQLDRKFPNETAAQHYNQVWGALKTRFAVPNYTQIRRDTFNEALEYLENWLSGLGAPKQGRLFDK
jgi:P22_AR N-terminal domain/ORF6C domain